jgi:hypothetical protein
MVRVAVNTPVFALRIFNEVLRKKAGPIEALSFFFENRKVLLAIDKSPSLQAKPG